MPPNIWDPTMNFLILLIALLVTSVVYSKVALTIRPACGEVITRRMSETTTTNSHVVEHATTRHVVLHP